MNLLKEKKGFTLVELIVTIAIISLAFGIAGTIITSIINNANNESTKVTKSNILNTARIYVEENIDSDLISWNTSEDKENYKFSCVSINELINKNLLKKSIKENYSLSNYVIVWKNESNSIISEEFDEKGICSGTDNSVQIPTKKDYCKTLKYNGSEQILTKDITTESFTFDENDNIGKNAGTYKIAANLNEGYYWIDGTTETKYINCSIEKYFPEIYLDSDGTTFEVGKTITIGIKSDTPGTINVKSSNNDYFKVSIIGENIIDNTEEYQEKISIELLSTREVEGYITITLTPEDLTNYYSSSKTFIIGNPTKQIIEIPTSEKYCKNSYYNAEIQNLIKTDKSTVGMTLYNYEAKEINTYTITAKLKYGYIWEDESIEDKTFDCSILRPTFTVDYNSNGGTGTITSDTILYEDEYTTKENTFTREGYNFIDWNEISDGTGISWKERINTPWQWTYLKNITLYAQWEANTYTIKYDGNGNTSGSTETSTHIYDTSQNLTANGFAKTGYEFNGWNTKADGTGTAYSNKQLIKNLTSNNNETITLYAQWKASTYNISYNLNNGTAGSNAPTSANIDTTIEISNPTRTYTITYNQNSTAATRSKTSEKVTYTFKGWTASNLNTSTAKYGTSSDSVTTSWNSSSTKVTATYFKNLALSTNTVTLTANWASNSTTLATVTKTGYTCTWNTNSDGSGTSYTSGNSGYTPTSNIVLYAICTANTYTIKYDGNGNTGGSTASSTHTYGVSSTLTTNGFTKTDYTFKNWNTKADGTGTTYTNEASIKNLTTTNETITLYAQWRENVYAIYNTSGTLTGYQDSLSNAISDAVSGGTIKALKNNSSGAVTISKNLTLNTNSYTITMTGILTNKATTTINGSGKITNSKSDATIYNTSSGSLTIKNCTIQNSYADAIANDSSGKLTIQNATISGYNRGISHTGSGNLVIKSGSSSDNRTTINGTYYAIYAKGTGTTIIEPENIDIFGSLESTGATIYNGEDNKLYIYTKETTQNNECSSYIISQTGTVITNLGTAYLGYQISLTTQPEYILDTSEQNYIHTCIGSQESYVITNFGTLDYTAGIRSYRATPDHVTNYNEGTFNLRGGRVYYNQDTKETGFAEPVDINRLGKISGQSSWAVYDETATLKIGNYTFNYVRYSFLKTL